MKAPNESNEADGPADFFCHVVFAEIFWGRGLFPRNRGLMFCSVFRQTAPMVAEIGYTLQAKSS